MLAVAAIQVLAWIVVTPPFQAPDEEAHFAYAQYLAETGDTPFTPAVSLEGRAESSQVNQALDLRGLRAATVAPEAKPATAPADERRWAAAEAALPEGASSNGSGPNAIGQNPPLYYGYEALAYHAAAGGDLFDRVFAMRLSGALLYLLTIALVWLIAREVFAGLFLPTVATAASALVPQLAFTGAVINSDALLIPVWAAFLLAAVRLLRRGPSAARVLGLSLACAASILTHGRGLAILVPALCVLALVWWRHRPPARVTALGATGAAVPVAAALAAALAHTSGFGGEVGRATGESFSPRAFVGYLWHFYLDWIPFPIDRVGPPYGYRQVWIDTFFGRFGSLQVGYPFAVYDLLQVLTALGLAGLAVAIFVRRDALRRHWDVFAVLGITVVSLLFLLHFSAYRDLAVGGEPLLVGRYLLPLVPVFGLAVAFVVGSLPRRLGAPLAAVLLAFGALLTLAGLGLSASRFYG